MIELAVQQTCGALQLAVELRSTATGLAIQGPSAAGKSSLLRLIAGVSRASQGRIVIAGESWLDTAAGHCLPACQRKVGWLPQDSLLLPHLDVRDNLLLGRPSSATLHEVSELLELTPLLTRRPRKLSGGERQRAALGRALCCEPRLLLLDEPFAALDLEYRDRLRTRLAAYLERLAIPRIVVSHLDEDFAGLVQERWFMQHGRTTGPHRLLGAG